MIDQQSIRVTPAPAGDATAVTLTIDGREVAFTLPAGQLDDVAAVNAAAVTAFQDAYFSSVEPVNCDDIDALQATLSDPEQTVNPDALFADLAEELNNIDLPALIRRVIPTE
jgi:hypothetical protein